MITSVHHIKEGYDPANPVHVYIGRSGMFNGKAYADIGYGNQFVMGKHGNRSVVIYRHNTELEKLKKSDSYENYLGFLLGKKLFCWCRPQACHGKNYLKAIQEQYGGNMIDEWTLETK